MFVKAIAIACGFMSVFCMICTWIGALLDSAEWMRFGGGLLVLSAVMLPVGLVMAAVGFVRGNGKSRWRRALDAALMLAAFLLAVLVHVGRTGGV